MNRAARVVAAYYAVVNGGVLAFAQRRYYQAEKHKGCNPQGIMELSVPQLFMQQLGSVRACGQSRVQKWRKSCYFYALTAGRAPSCARRVCPRRPRRPCAARARPPPSGVCLAKRWANLWRVCATREFRGIRIGFEQAQILARVGPSFLSAGVEIGSLIIDFI